MTEWAKALSNNTGPNKVRPNLRSKSLKQHLGNLGQPRQLLSLLKACGPHQVQPPSTAQMLLVMGSAMLGGDGYIWQQA